MRIATTYENGNIFQHFGRTENFKVYEVEDGKVVSSEVMNSNGVGHEALAYLLADKDIDVLICGGMGAGAQAALADAGVEVIAGAEGDSDAAVESFLAGQLESTGVNCDHHDHDHGSDEGCGSDCASGGCGGCPGCGEPQIVLEGKNAGKICQVHYIGSYDDGTLFESSYEYGEPLQYYCGMGVMIPGFDKAVVDMEVGDIVDIHLEPEEAYGMPDPNLIMVIEKDRIHGLETLTVGEKATFSDQFGRPFQVLVTDMDDTTVTLDANHEMAGKALNFRIELVSVN